MTDIPSKQTTDPTSGYRVIGMTYDGVKVLAPKMKPKAFTAAAARRAIRRALKEKRP